MLSLIKGSKRIEINDLPYRKFYILHAMGDPPRAVQPGKLLESVCYRTFVLWPLESGNWGSLSLRTIPPRTDRGNCHTLKLENPGYSYQDRTNLIAT